MMRFFLICCVVAVVVVAVVWAINYPLPPGQYHDAVTGQTVTVHGILPGGTYRVTRKIVVRVLRHEVSILMVESRARAELTP